MILDRPIGEITKEFHDGYMQGDISIHEYLEKHGVEIQLMNIRDDPQPGHIYLGAVPSLNIKGHSHQVIIDARKEENGFVMIDPNKGRDGKEWYVNYVEGSELAPGEFQVITCNYDYRLTIPIDKADA